ncbi:hypothetical protein [Parapedobacter sp.]
MAIVFANLVFQLFQRFFAAVILIERNGRNGQDGRKHNRRFAVIAHKIIPFGVDAFRRYHDSFHKPLRPSLPERLHSSAQVVNQGVCAPCNQLN